MSSNNQIKKTQTRKDIVLEDVYYSRFQREHTKTAVLSQIVTTVTVYPSRVISNNFQDNIFSTSDFDQSANTYTREDKRIVFMMVPNHIDRFEMEKRIVSKGGCLYRIISNDLILDEDDRLNLDINVFTKEELALKQIFKNKDTNRFILDKNGKVQYRRIFYSKTMKEDVDLRTNDTHQFLPDIIKAEIIGASIFQTQKL